MALTKINASVIANNTIAVGNIADNSVDATKIASNSILTRHIDDAQITTDQILDGTIATADIADDAVTSAKIDTNIDIAGTFDVTGATTLDSTLAVAGDANFDSGTLSVDVSENKVGIGTTSPLTKLHVEIDDTDDSLFVTDTRAYNTSNNGGVVAFGGKYNSSNAITTWGQIHGIKDDNTDGTFAGHLKFLTRTTSALTERMRINSSGNVGIGAIPKVTEAGWTNLSVGGMGALINSTSANAGGRTQLSNNIYVDESGNYSYISTDEASLYKQINGIHSWHNAASGSADAHITLSERMRITSDGKVGLNKSDPSAYLDVHAPSGVASPTVAIFKSDQHGLQLGIDITSTATYVQSNHASYPLILNATTGGHVGVGEHNNLERTLTVGTKLAKTSTSTAVPFAIQTNETSANGRFSMHYIGGASAADRKVYLQMEEDGVANAGQIHLNHYGGTVHSPQGIIFGTETTAAHTLDDYEEGTWTPTLSSGSISVSSANYVKIGRFIHLNTYFTFSGLANNGTVMKINGLPYNCTSGNHYGGGVISYSHSANTNDLTPLVASGNNYIYFHELDGTSGVVTQGVMYDRFANGAGYLLINMSYMTT